VQPSELEAQFLNACHRLGAKGLLSLSSDSLSTRIPGTTEMIFATAVENWRDLRAPGLTRRRFECDDSLAALHGLIYLERPDVGAIAISSPRGVRLLARSGEALPPLFDEQVRHIGPSNGTSLSEGSLSRERIRSALGRGANATLLGAQLLCLGTTCDRVLFNTELFEKCAQAYVIAKASGIRIGLIPRWVRLVAHQRLRKDERTAAADYMDGKVPAGTSAY
jgi:hypothetical protein